VQREFPALLAAFSPPLRARCVQGSAGNSLRPLLVDDDREAFSHPVRFRELRAQLGELFLDRAKRAFLVHGELGAAQAESRTAFLDDLSLALLSAEKPSKLAALVLRDSASFWRARSVLRDLRSLALYASPAPGCP